MGYFSVPVAALGPVWALGGPQWAKGGRGGAQAGVERGPGAGGGQRRWRITTRTGQTTGAEGKHYLSKEESAYFELRYAPALKRRISMQIYTCEYIVE